MEFISNQFSAIKATLESWVFPSSASRGSDADGATADAENGDNLPRISTASGRVKKSLAPRPSRKSTRKSDNLRRSLRDWEIRKSSTQDSDGSSTNSVIQIGFKVCETIEEEYPSQDTPIESLVDESLPEEPPPSPPELEPPKPKAQEFFSSAPPKPPPRRAPPKPVVYYTTSSNQIRRAYTNRCEKYCMGPITIVVEALGTIVLALVNTFLLSLALMLIGIGYIIMEKKDPYDSYLKQFESHFEHSMMELGMEQKKGGSQLESYIEALAYPLIVFGGGVGLLSLMGIVGACFDIRCLLSLYSRICALVLLFEFCVFLFIYDGEPTAGKLQLFDSIDHYTGLEGENAITIGWNQLMNAFNCCGVDSYMDFHHRKNWPPKSIKNQTYKLKTPIFCCKTKELNFSCALEEIADPSNNNMEIGCYLLLYDALFKNDYTMGLFGLLMLFQEQ